MPKNSPAASSPITLLDQRVFRLFVDGVVEIRSFGLKSKSFYGRNVYGYFDEFEPFRKAVGTIERSEAEGTYFTLQKIDPRLIGRSCNHLSQAAQGMSTSDGHVLAYRWLPIDLDPIRPKGISSSDTELAAAIKLRDDIAGEIQTEYGLNPPIKAMSGNGGHLLYRLPNLPVSEKPHIEATLARISSQYSTDQVNIDVKVANPSRIWKLYGSTARKGDAVPAGPNREARPHRLATIDDIPQEIISER